MATSPRSWHREDDSLVHLAAFGGAPHLDSPWAPWPAFTQSEVEAVAGVLRSGRVNYWTGGFGREFEAEYSQSLGRKHALCVANGTLALELALRAFAIGPGDEVLVPCRTFIATASAVVAVGATPVLADVDSVHGLLDLSSAEELLTASTRAIIPVHLGGMPCDMTAMCEFARKHSLIVIEDCAQAHGARWLDGAVGSHGDAAAFSFCQDKIITTGGEGGMLLLDDQDAYERAWSYRDHGKSRVLVEQPSTGSARTVRYIHESLGSNWRLTEMQSVIGLLQLRRLPEIVETRTSNARVLARGLSGLPGVRVPAVPGGATPSYYRQYVTIVPRELAPGWNRDRILEACAAEGVPCFEGSCADIGREQAMVDYAGGDRPGATTLGANSLALLVHPGLTTSYMEQVVAAVGKVMRAAQHTPWPEAG